MALKGKPEPNKNPYQKTVEGVQYGPKGKEATEMMDKAKNAMENGKAAIDLAKELLAAGKLKTLPHMLGAATLEGDVASLKQHFHDVKNLVDSFGKERHDTIRAMTEQINALLKVINKHKPQEKPKKKAEGPKKAVGTSETVAQNAMDLQIATRSLFEKAYGEKFKNVVYPAFVKKGEPLGYKKFLEGVQGVMKSLKKQPLSAKDLNNAARKMVALINSLPGDKFKDKKLLKLAKSLAKGKVAPKKAAPKLKKAVKESDNVPQVASRFKASVRKVLQIAASKKFADEAYRAFYNSGNHIGYKTFVNGIGLVMKSLDKRPIQRKDLKAAADKIVGLFGTFPENLGEQFLKRHGLRLFLKRVTGLAKGKATVSKQEGPKKKPAEKVSPALSKRRGAHLTSIANSLENTFSYNQTTISISETKALNKVVRILSAKVRSLKARVGQDKPLTRAEVVQNIKDLRKVITSSLTALKADNVRGQGWPIFKRLLKLRDAKTMLFASIPTAKSTPKKNTEGQKKKPAEKVSLELSKRRGQHLTNIMTEMKDAYSYKPNGLPKKENVVFNKIITNISTKFYAIKARVGQNKLLTRPEVVKEVKAMRLLIQNSINKLKNETSTGGTWPIFKKLKALKYSDTMKLASIPKAENKKES